MNCRGDDDVDAKRSRPSIGKTRKVPREERARAFGWDPISESHQGQRPQRLHSKAGDMADPNASRKRQIFLALRAPSIHGTFETYGDEARRTLSRHCRAPILTELMAEVRASTTEGTQAVKHNDHGA